VPVADAPAHHAVAPINRTERAVFRAINRTRRRHGLPGLRLAADLSGAAAWHSADQAVNHFLSHSSSDGTPFAQRIRRTTNARTCGETLIEFRGHLTGRRIVRAWMHSPPHRAELLYPSFRRIGIGLARSRGETVVTADFASGN
jgi:uncharacterized protein YkwD